MCARSKIVGETRKGLTAYHILNKEFTQNSRTFFKIIKHWSIFIFSINIVDIPYLKYHIIVRIRNIDKSFRFLMFTAIFTRPNLTVPRMRTLPQGTCKDDKVATSLNQPKQNINIIQPGFV